MSLKGQNVLITGASMGIGAAIAKHLGAESANLARSQNKLKALQKEIQASHSGIKVITTSVDIIAMTGTNINGLMFTTYAVLNEGKMKERSRGTILNVTSVTGLEVPPFPGEAVYHSSKAAQEAFTNVLRIELSGTNIKVLALRPGVVATNFHEQRVGYDKGMYEDSMAGYEPLIAEDVAEAAAFMLSTKERVSVKALDVVPTAQRSLPVFDRKWKERNRGCLVAFARARKVTSGK